MNGNISTPAEAIAVLRHGIKTRMAIVRVLTTLQEQLDADRICGSWLSAENNLSAVIRRIGTGTYRVLVFDNTLCYKRLVQDTVITAERRALFFSDPNDAQSVHYVEYRPGDDTLILGCYGRFIAEDSIRRRNDEGLIADEEHPDDAAWERKNDTIDIRK